MHLLNEVKNNRSDIARVELMVRENNSVAIKLYKSIGFEMEGVLRHRLLDADGNTSSDIAMSWLNPNFKKSKKNS